MSKKNSNSEVSIKTCSPKYNLTSYLWSALGSFLGIYLISISNELLNFNASDHLFLVGSFGASAVLLYGSPKVNFAQPRHLIGGHILSAIIGVTVYKYIHLDVAITSAIAVSLSIVAMQITKTTHPPGGATALIAIIGSQDIHQLGYFYVLMPISTGIVVMLLIALLINNLSKDPLRKYPKYWF